MTWNPTNVASMKTNNIDQSSSASISAEYNPFAPVNASRPGAS
jgi:hypothetical protein